MIRDFRRWLGAARIQGLILLFTLTGSASLILQIAFPDEAWVVGAQTALVLVFIGGAAWIVSGAMSPQARQRLAFTVVPALGAVAVGIFVPGLFRLFLGVGVGWLIAAQFLMRDSGQQRDYKMAIRAMRKNEYEKAIGHMNALIKREPDVPEHYGFRAQLHRLNNDLRRASRDYEKMLTLDPESGVGSNGLAEISLQKNNLPEARHWAEIAYEKAPQDWVAVYNLGMIAERQHEDEQALKSLTEALAMNIPESRHRLLIKFWLARIYFRQGEKEKAADMVKQLSKEKSGLREWEIILESKEAAHLRALLQQDVRLAQALVNGKSLVNTFDDAG